MHRCVLSYLHFFVQTRDVMAKQCSPSTLLMMCFGSSDMEKGAMLRRAWFIWTSSMTTR
jgi:hypothetical protein